MYGPVETTSAPYAPGLPSKQRATSTGIGAVAGSVSRCGRAGLGGGGGGEERVPGGSGDVVVADERAQEQVGVDPVRAEAPLGGRVEAAAPVEVAAADRPGGLPADAVGAAGRRGRARR